MDAHDRQLAAACAERIAAAFTSYHVRFKEIARRSKARFETRYWQGIQRDSRERLDLYTIELRGALSSLSEQLGERLRDTEIWKAIKPLYEERVSPRGDLEIAETFLNSVTRRVFTTVGVNPEIEFVAPIDERPRPDDSRIFRSYTGDGSTRNMLARIVADYRFHVRYRDLERELDAAAERVDEHLMRYLGGRPVETVDVVKPLFFRNKGAYIVGRMRVAGETVPLVLPLLNRKDGVSIDAVLVETDDVSIVFSFTRSYFLVESERPSELIAFLKSIMPLKPIAELYTAIGYNKHGKTELYRDLLRHMRATDDRFEPAAGTKGMVMSVFTLPGYDVVFKVIRDRFDFPKNATRRNVLDRYKLVFKHDRVGRLVDTQEFEYLTFDRDRFSDEVIAELVETASSAIAFEGDTVVLKHLYTERRMTPLNLFVRQAAVANARDAVVDYGNAIKDLAAANIFPGDMLLKNFGVTRHGRVAFYDYDEVCLLTDCAFRRIPPSRNDEDELMDEAWFAVGEHDIFPEEFRTFLGLEGELRAAFERAHSDLYGTRFWTTMQERLRAGEIADIFPYKQELRLGWEEKSHG